jgi:hypothetical protein
MIGRFNSGFYVKIMIGIMYAGQKKHRAVKK